MNNLTFGFSNSRKNISFWLLSEEKHPRANLELHDLRKFIVSKIEETMIS